LEVIETASMVELDDVLDDACLEETTVNTDEWNGYNRIGQRQGRVHRSVDHSGPDCQYTSPARIHHCLLTGSTRRPSRR
jgi:hypothetical protein